MNIHTPTSEAARVAEVLSHDFLPYQERWINDESRRKLAEKTRRCGLTFAEEFRRVERICKQGARYDAYITSKDEGLAKQFIREAKDFADRFKLAGTIAGEELFGEGKARGTAYTLEAATGRRIYSLSSNPDQQAGRAGDRTADEFALHKEQLELFKIMKLIMP
jgi:phage FluMu gp28-like protein